MPKITKNRRKPKVVRSAEQLFGDLRGRVVYHDDILAPTSDEWSPRPNPRHSR
jgi:hypothetical protein